VFKRILVGVDHHQGGRDAVALAKRLGAPTGELTLAHVYGTGFFDRTAHHNTEAERSAEILQDAQEYAGITGNVRSHPGASVGRGLHELCEAIYADLLVVGSSRRGALGRVLLADDTRGALDAAPCALAVAPAGYSQQPAPIGEVGVAYNGSAESEHALAMARRIAAEHQARLSAFEAVPIPAYTWAPDIDAYESTLEDELEEARQRIAALGDVEPHTAIGLPPEELAVYSASLDLLVVGSRGYGPMGRLLHGSVARRLLGHARCPLLILTRAARDADAAGPEPEPAGATAA